MVTPSTAQTSGLARLHHSRHATSSPDRIISPPIVGVPFLAKCDSGPSERIGWPLPCLTRRRLMIVGPNSSTKNSAVTVAPPARKVM